MITHNDETQFELDEDGFYILYIILYITQYYIILYYILNNYKPITTGHSFSSN